MKDFQIPSDYEVYAFDRWWPLFLFENPGGQRLFVAECPFVAAFPTRGGLTARLNDGTVRVVEVQA